MHIGISPGVGPVDTYALRAMVGATEGLGYHSIWVSRPGGDDAEHLAIVALVAGATRRARVATDGLMAWTTGVDRQARILAAVHWLSDHRLTVGLAAGGPDEATIRLIEALGEPTAAATRPEVLLSGDDILAAIAVRADGWITDVDDVARVHRAWTTLLERAADAGRDPAGLRLVARAPAFDEALLTTLDALEHAGADEVILVGDPGRPLDELLDVCAHAAEEFLP